MITLKDFIKITLIKEIKEIQQTGNHHYLSFGLISQGIEFLGYCLDSNSYFIDNQSESRFRNTIKNLFPTKYHPFNIKNGKYDLYKDLRCGILHVCLPKPNIELIQRREINDFGNHLEIKNIRDKDMLILVSEELFNDFENACNKIIERIDDGKISNKDLLVTEL